MGILILSVQVGGMRTGRPTVAVVLSDAERKHLESLARRSRTAPQLARRARIVLGCAAGQNKQDNGPPPAVVAGDRRQVAFALRTGPGGRLAR